MKGSYLRPSFNNLKLPKSENSFEIQIVDLDQ